MKLSRLRLSATTALLLAASAAGADDGPSVRSKDQATEQPPFAGTLFIHPDIVTDSDPTTFESINYQGRSLRTMFDRRKDAWIRAYPYLFDASYQDGLRIEVQVNPEFEGRDKAQAEALKYARMIGQLPTLLRVDVETVWIHRGNNSLGGGNNNLLIHTGHADSLAQRELLEEGSYMRHPTLRSIQVVSGRRIGVPPKRKTGDSFPPMLATTRSGKTLPRASRPTWRCDTGRTDCRDLW